MAFTSGGESFGKVEQALAIEPYDAKQLSMSAVALSNQLQRVGDDPDTLDSALLENKVPLVVQGMQITPSASNHFKTSDKAAIYVEVYEPLLMQPKPPEVGLEIRILDRKSGAQKADFGYTNTGPSMHVGNPVIPVGMRLPLETLTPGDYRVELRAVDSAGGSTTPRAADFVVE